MAATDRKRKGSSIVWLEKNDDTSASSISLSNPTKSSPSVAVLSAPSIEIIGEVKAPVRAAPVASVAVPAPQKPLNPWVLHLIKEAEELVDRTGDWVSKCDPRYLNYDQEQEWTEKFGNETEAKIQRRRFDLGGTGLTTEDQVNIWKNLESRKVKTQ
ncbi:hypothetical protein PRIPAC_96697 [Pristionchus pacificus]|uniref:Uncharacterized protein n=1 Tax=Pristionchus pacificus TaxID=54126 RepID=A0A2A6CU91_PRIPA|nr:hypothetical protein PRIPAC_96697 [Pristionchus pacificus]|eukprot:PDM81804.1 hypothetical protein PRIPAC_33958 [Pristionchus pacificus]